MIPGKFPYGEVVFGVLVAAFMLLCQVQDLFVASMVLGVAFGMQIARILEEVFYWRVKRKAEKR